MTVKTTVSLTDQAYALARQLVEEGRFASISAVVQHGLASVQRENEAHQARLDAIRADLDRRAAQESLSVEDVDKLLSDWRASRST